MSAAALDHRAPPRTHATRSLPIALPWIAQRMARVVLRRRYRVEVHGAGRVPRSGPVLLSVNHIGYLDGPLLVALAPRVSHALVNAVLGTRLPGASIHSRPLQGSRLVVSFGQPVPVTAVPWPRRRDEVGALTERLRQTLADHVAATAGRSGLALPGRAPDEVDDLVPR